MNTCIIHCMRLSSINKSGVYDGKLIMVSLEDSPDAYVRREIITDIRIGLLQFVQQGDEYICRC